MELSNIEKSQKIKYQRMPELVKEQLMDWIMDGTISMGEKLNAEDLASRMGVSRMPVREALKSMEKSGIVHSIPYVGTRVAELEMTDIVQIYLMREALEPLAVYYSCKNITDLKLQAIESLHSRLENVISEPTPNAKQIFVLNRDFHFEIYSASGMNHLINIIATLWDNLAFYKLIYGRKYATDKSSALSMLGEHRAYIENLKKRQAKELKTLMHDSLHRRVLELKDQVTYEI
jgi:DNA-binding GntR family transcriptional regulator